MLDEFIATNATVHKVNSYYTLAISYSTYCVGQRTILALSTKPLAPNKIKFASLRYDT